MEFPGCRRILAFNGFAACGQIPEAIPVCNSMAAVHGAGSPIAALDFNFYFDNVGNMEMNAALTALSALAQETRLAIFRWLVEVGPTGAAAGDISREFGLPGATLSFHLTQLKQAGLVSCRRDGRSLIYAAEFDTMGALMAYLTENCCGGRDDLCFPPLKETDRGIQTVQAGD
jgi:ArsR family transcriptional regulator